MVRYISSPRQQHEEQKTKDTTMVKPEEDQEANTKTTAAVKMEEEEEEDETKETVSTVKSDKEDEAVSSSTPNRKNTNKSNKQTKKKSKSTSKKTAVKMEEEEEDEVKKESTSDGDEGDNKDDSKSPSDTKTTNATKTKAVEKPKKSKVKPELQDKILAYMGQELQVNDRPEVTKQEVAEGCGYSKAGVHNFFYSWQDMQKEKKWIEKSSAKGCFRLTQLGRDNIPQGVILVAKRHDNAGKQDYYLKALCKQCKEAKEDKSSIMFDILKDGEWHNLDEFTAATGYKNLKSKGLGYAFTHMEKKMKILEKNSETKQYRFTDKCFPDGRP